MACSADLRNTQKQERRTNNQGEPKPPQQQQTKEQNSNMQNTEHHKRQQQGQERRHLGVEKAPPNATKMRPTAPPPKIYPFLGFFGRSFSSFWGLMSGLLGRSLGFWGCWGLLLGLPAAIFGLRRGGCPAEAEKGPKSLKTAQNSSQTCFLSLFGPLGRPQNSSHSMI